MKPHIQKLFIALFLLSILDIQFSAALAQDSVTPPPGLVAWWPGNGNAVDIVGGNNGTLSNGVTYVPGEVQQAFNFNADSAMVLLTNSPALQLQNFTVETWIKRGSLTAVYSDANAVAGNALMFGYGNSGYSFAMGSNGNLILTWVDHDDVVSSAAVTDTTWHHIAVTTTNGTVVFYLDGTAYPAASYLRTYTFATAPAIGGRADNLNQNNNDSFLGSIDEISVYNRALTATEIQSVYQAGAAGKYAAYYTNPPASFTNYHFDAVADFGTNANPNGSWSYGTLSAFTSGTFRLFTTALPLPGFTGSGVAWYNGGAPAGVVIKNTTNITIDGASSVFIPTNYLDVDGQGNIASVRWIAPATSHYRIAGSFERSDDQPMAVDAEILENGTNQLFSTNNFTGFTQVAAFNLTNVLFAAGTVLDFAQSCPFSPNHDGTGLAATIVTLLPQVTGVGTSGGNLIITGNNGVPGATFEVLTSTSLTVPLAHWMPLTSQAFDANGNFSLTNLISPATAQQYFVIIF